MSYYDKHNYKRYDVVYLTYDEYCELLKSIWSFDEFVTPNCELMACWLYSDTFRDFIEFIYNPNYYV